MLLFSCETYHGGKLGIAWAKVRAAQLTTIAIEAFILKRF
jgi:hypothetical protein